MDKITIKGIPFKLQGTPIQKGKTLNFKAKGTNGEDFHISDIKGIKIISLFPDINTRVCDKQTQEISRLAFKNKNVTFISISTDIPEIQNQWCAAHNIENILIVSDREYGEFAKQTNVFIPKIKKLGRGFILLDENNIIQDIVTNKEISADPDFETLASWIK